MPRIGILAGVKTELDALAPVSGHADAPLIRLSGARPTRAYNGVRDLIELGVDGILSFGTAGAIDPSLKPGEIIVAHNILGPDGTETATDHAWTTEISTVLEVEPKGVVGLSDVANTKTKSRLYAETGRVAVDMESHIVAELAAEAGLPFAVLRAVVDPADFEFPDFVLDSVRPDGSVSLLPIVAGLCIQPWLFGRLLDLNKYNAEAMTSLSRATRTLGPRCGLRLFTL